MKFLASDVDISKDGSRIIVAVLSKHEIGKEMWEKSKFLSTEAAGLSGTSLVRMFTGLAKHDKLGEAVVISGNGQFISVRSPKNKANGVLNSGTKVEESKNTEQSHQVRCIRHLFTVSKNTIRIRKWRGGGGLRRVEEG